jgi:hypothetical protein
MITSLVNCITSRHLLVGFVIAAWIIPLTNSQVDTSVDYMTRLNYGFAAIKIRRISVADDYYRYTFHLALPQRPNNANLTVSYPCDTATMCHRMRVLQAATGNLTRSMQTLITDMVSRISNLIPDADARSYGSPFARLPRGLINAAGQMQSFLFGVSTQADTDQLRDEISKIKELSEASSASSDRVRLGLTSFTKLENSRLDKLHQAIAEQQRSMGEIYAQIRTLTDTTYYEYAAIAFLAQEIAKYIEVQQNVQQIEEGVEALLQGQLSPKLLSVELIRQVIANITAELETTAYYLCLKTPQYVYESRNFDYARHGNDLIIRLRLPYSRYTPLNFYRSIVFPLRVNGQQGYVTELQQIPTYFLSNIARGLVAEVESIPQTPVIELYAVKWHTQTAHSCLYNLLIDKPNVAKITCQFTARKQVIEPTYIRLDKGVFILSNYTHVRARCLKDNLYDLTNTTCFPCFAQIECDCSLLADDEIIATPADRCMGHERFASQLLHGINLPLLQSFYDLTNISVSTKNLITPQDYREPAAMHWKIYSENVSQLLASDQQSSYFLQKLTETFEKGSYAFHSPAEALLHDFLTEYSPQQQFWFVNFNSWTTYALLLLYVLAIICLFIQYRYYQRLRILQAVATHGAQLLPRTAASELKAPDVTPQPSTNSYLQIVANSLEQIRHIDFALAILCFVALILTIILIIVMKRKLTRRSALYADIVTAEKIIQLKITDFPDVSRAFSVAVPAHKLELRARSFLCCGIVTVTEHPWRIFNSLTHQNIKMPTRIFVSARKAIAIKKALKRQHDIVQLVIHSCQHASPIIHPDMSETVVV